MLPRPYMRTAQDQETSPKSAKFAIPARASAMGGLKFRHLGEQSHHARCDPHTGLAAPASQNNRAVRTGHISLYRPLHREDGMFLQSRAFCSKAGRTKSSSE